MDKLWYAGKGAGLWDTWACWDKSPCTFTDQRKIRV